MATLAQVETSEVVISSSSTSNTGTLSTSVTTTKAFMWWGLESTDADPQNNYIAGQVTNSTTVTFIRNNGGAECTIRFYVVEHSAGVTVEHGSTTLTGSSGTITINDVGDVTEAFFIPSWEHSGTIFNDDDNFLWSYSSTTVVAWSSNATAEDDVYWQSVVWSGATTETTSVSMSTSQASNTGSITALTVAQSFLYCSSSKGSGSMDPASAMINAYFSSSSEVTVLRSEADSLAYDVNVHTVELPSGDVEQTEAVAFSTASGTASHQVTLSTTLTSTSNVMPITGGTFPGWGNTSKNDNDIIGFGSFNVTVDDSTHCTATRAAATGYTGALRATIVEFAGSGGGPAATIHNLALMGVGG